MQSVLVMFRSDGERRSFSLARDVTVIGRREDCDLRIPLGEISRKHCRIIHDGESFRIEDLGSSNGTFHNGLRVQEATLSAGDSVQVGPVVFVLQIDGVPADDELAPIVAAPAADATAVPQEQEAAAAQIEVPAEEGYEDPPTEIVQPDEDEDDGFDDLMDEVLQSGEKRKR